MKDNVFLQRLRSIMLDNKNDRIVKKRRKGKLDGVNAWRAKTGTDKIFKDKQEKKGKRYSVVLLVDQSGSTMGYSMRKQKCIHHLAKVARWMAESFEKVDVDFAIIGFNEKLRIYKDFDAKVKNYDELEENFQSKRWIQQNGFVSESCTNFDEDVSVFSGNHDYDAINMAYRVLRQRKGEKILMVFSDGWPHCDHPSLCTYPRELHKPQAITNLILDNPHVKTVGIGIDDDSVKGIYPNWIMTPSVTMEDVKTEVLKFLKKHIKRM